MGRIGPPSAPSPTATSRLLDGTLTGNDTQKIRFVTDAHLQRLGDHHLPRLGQIDRHRRPYWRTLDLNGGTTAYSTVTDTASVAISAVNDTPVLTTPTAISLTDTSATDAFVTNQTGTLSATDVDGTTLTYGITDGTSGSVTSSPRPTTSRRPAPTARSIC